MLDASATNSLSDRFKTMLIFSSLSGGNMSGVKCVTEPTASTIENVSGFFRGNGKPREGLPELSKVTALDTNTRVVFAFLAPCILHTFKVIVGQQVDVLCD